MADADSALMQLIRGIVAGDSATVTRSLATSPNLASASLRRQGGTRRSSREDLFAEIKHLVYVGDTPLHVVAAAYRHKLVPELVAIGADVRASNRRGAQPLHYAADGVPGSAHWDPIGQRDTVVALLAAGADPNAVDKGGVTPLHRAVRNRCAAAVRALLEGGADPRRPNGSGSTPMRLAQLTTGRGGSGSEAAKAEQREIVRLLIRRGAE